MTFRHIIEDIESIFESLLESKDYDVAFASYFDDDSGKIEFRIVETSPWYDDEEFFLVVPSGCAKHYSLESGQFEAEIF